MKYLIIIALALAVFWIWRHNRQAEKDATRAPPRRSPSSKGGSVTEMVACDLCHMHLPKSEALIGSEGIYCSDAHRREAGAR